jgi:rhodanese-related sulfurtransferase
MSKSINFIEYRSPEAVRLALRTHREIALVDVRSEARFAHGHPLFAASLPLYRLMVEVLDRIPRRATPLVVYGDGEDDAQAAVARLTSLGYHDVALLENGLEGWRSSGGELFLDVNVPSKAFGELVDTIARTPAVDAQELCALLDGGADVVILDARRFEEYHTMSIPTARSGDSGRRELRWSHPQHQRRPVAHQRRRAAAREGAAERHDRLDAGRPGTRPRPGSTADGAEQR